MLRRVQAGASRGEAVPTSVVWGFLVPRLPPERQQLFAFWVLMPLLHVQPFLAPGKTQVAAVSFSFFPVTWRGCGCEHVNLPAAEMSWGRSRPAPCPRCQQTPNQAVRPV